MAVDKLNEVLYDGLELLIRFGLFGSFGSFGSFDSFGSFGFNSY